MSPHAVACRCHYPQSFVVVLSKSPATLCSSVVSKPPGPLTVRVDQRDLANREAEPTATLTASRILETSPGSNAPDWTKYTTRPQSWTSAPVLSILHSPHVDHASSLFSHSLYTFVATACNSGYTCTDASVCNCLGYSPGNTTRSILETKTLEHPPPPGHSIPFPVSRPSPYAHHLLLAAAPPQFKTRRSPAASRGKTLMSRSKA